MRLSSSVLAFRRHRDPADNPLLPPARRVTVSLEESKVVIWKTGMSFTSLFNVGVPPRQGGPAPGEPFKTYDFHIGDEGSSARVLLPSSSLRPRLTLSLARPQAT